MNGRKKWILSTLKTHQDSRILLCSTEQKAFWLKTSKLLWIWIITNNLEAYFNACKYTINIRSTEGAAFTKRNILTRFDEVVKLSSSLIMSALNVNALFKAFWYCVLLHICSWFSFCIFSFALSARSSQSSMVPAFGFKIQTNSGPYIPILYNYQKKKSFIPQYMAIKHMNQSSLRLAGKYIAIFSGF